MHDKTLYHIISSRDIPVVLQHGLIPHMGNNSISINEERNAVYLCKEQDIEYWQIMLKEKTDVLAIDMTGIPDNCIDEFRYSCYGEYIVNCSIPPEKIKWLRPLNETTPEYEKAMVTLCKSHLIHLSWFTQICARHYQGICHTEPCPDYIVHDGLSLKIVLPRLNYGIRTQEYWKDYLREYGEDGEYTFCDFHNNTQTKLWQKLIEYPDDKSAEYRRFAYEYINNTFPWAKTLNTGGWADYRSITTSKGGLYDN